MKKNEFVETGTVKSIVAAIILYNKAQPFYKYTHEYLTEIGKRFR